MARKNKKKSSGPPAAELAQRELSKGNLRSAVKQARAAYRIDASEANRSLLHRSLLGRAKELYETAMAPQATAVLEELAGLGQLPADLQPEFARLRTLVGGWKSPAGQADADPALLRELANQAVLRGAHKGLPAELAQQASRIRESLEAVEAGKDELAQDLLKEIGRNSPLSDWKLLVRGLIALAQGDLERVRGNWDRIGEDSPTRHIAQSLLLANQYIQPNEASPAVQRAVANMNRRLVSSFALDLKQAIAMLDASDGDLDGFRKALRYVVNRHRSGPYRESALRAQMLILGMATEYVYEDEMRELLREFPVSPAEESRLLALAAEDPDDELAGYPFWLEFLKRLPNDPAYSPEEKRLARTRMSVELAARCLNRRMELKAIEARESRKDDDHDLSDSEAWASLQQRLHRDSAAFAQKAIEHAEEACRLSPDYAPALLTKAQALLDAGQSEEGLQSYLQFVQAFPQKLRLCRVAILRCLHEGYGAAFWEAAAEMFRVAPRDPERRELYWRVLVAAYCDACRQRDAERIALLWNQLSEFDGPPKSPTEMLALQIAAAVKQGDCKLSDHLIRDAKTPSRFALAVRVAVAAAQMNVSKTTLAGLCKDVAKLVKERKSGEVAVEAVRVLDNLPEPYRLACDDLLSHVYDYVGRCGRVQWKKEDLLETCRFVFQNGGDLELLKKLATQGTRKFPGMAHFFIYRALLPSRSMLGFFGLNAEQILLRVQDSEEPIGPVEETALHVVRWMNGESWRDDDDDDDEDQW